MMEEAKRQTGHNFFMEFFIIAAWTIWKRGTTSFSAEAPHPSKAGKGPFLGKLISNPIE
jgi:hypothetical protein